jgi:glutamyl-tRNA synthetase
MVRVRFAPSPTGPLHIGGVRTALFNYLFAKQNNGHFILRIEDTDQQRFVNGAEEYIIDSLNWCGLVFDEGPHTGGPYGPYRQSERKTIYSRYAMQLVEDGNAYYAFDTPEELEMKRQENGNFQYDRNTRMQMQNSLTLSIEETAQRIASDKPYVIRIRIPENRQIEVNDLIRGMVHFDSNLLDDKVIFKSDGLPTYHLANIADDHLMEITHVIRGEEWLPSAPLHVILYEFLGWKHPQFAHLPLILKPQGNGKLSKRDGDKMGFPVFPCDWTDPQSGETSKGYREWGYLPEAFVNMLAMLGWNPGTVQEIFSIDELIQQFSLEKVQKAGAKFDPEKTKWFNHQYLLTADLKNYTECFRKTISENGGESSDDYLVMVLDKIKDRMNLLTEFWQHACYFFKNPDSYNAEVISKHITPESWKWMADIAEQSENLTTWKAENIELALKQFIQEKELPAGKVFNLLRVSLTGTNQGIGIADIIALLGKKHAVARMRKFSNYLKSNY